MAFVQQHLGESSENTENLTHMDLLSSRICSLTFQEDVASGKSYDEERAIGECPCGYEHSKDSKMSTETNAKKGCKKSCDTVLSIISLDEVAWHDTIDDCWLVIYDYVYDCTEMLKNHPGGMDVLLEYAGRDATLAFIGTGHSKMAKQVLENYLIGELPKNERIFRISGGVKVLGF